jgi:hypothetical protein
MLQDQVMKLKKFLFIFGIVVFICSALIVIIIIYSYSIFAGAVVTAIIGAVCFFVSLLIGETW